MQGAENFFGRWRLDPERSTFQYGMVPRAGEMVIEPTPDGLRIRLELEGSRGTPIVIDGVWGTAEPERRTIEVVDPRTLRQTVLAAGEVKTTTRRELSEDGGIQTVIDEGEEAGGEPWRNEWVFVRTAPS